MSDFDIEHFPTSPAALRMMSRISPIYDRSYVGKWIFQVMGLEMDDARLRFEELRLQAFPETATWGLMYWEQRYGITPATGQTLEERRRAVLLKRNAREPINPKKLERIIQTMTGMEATVTENVAPYTFSVEIRSDGSPIDFDAVMSKLKRIKPSHQRMILRLAADVGIRIKPARQVYPFPYRMAGTHPQTNIVGVLQDAEIDIEAAGTATGFTYTFAGEHLAGTVPHDNYTGAIRDGGLSASIDTFASPFEYPICGDDDAT